MEKRTDIGWERSNVLWRLAGTDSVEFSSTIFPSECARLQSADREDKEPVGSLVSSSQASSLIEDGGRRSSTWSWSHSFFQCSVRVKKPSSGMETRKQLSVECGDRSRLVSVGAHKPPRRKVCKPLTSGIAPLSSRKVKSSSKSISACGSTSSSAYCNL